VCNPYNPASTLQSGSPPRRLPLNELNMTGFTMSIDELLAQLQVHRETRRQRDYRPDWLKTFIQNAANLFEPLEGYGRAGFDCQLDERGWIVSMYLGATEIIGGSRDGHIEHASFRMNLDQLQLLFDKIHHFEWYSLADGPAANAPFDLRSLVAVHGVLSSGNDHQVRLEVLSVPPTVVKPGLHLRPDGDLFES